MISERSEDSAFHPSFDPIQVEVWRHLFSSIAEEMGATLERTGFSPNIKERLDHSCAIFDSKGRLLAQAAHIPVHLGAMPMMMEQLLGEVDWRPGSMWICNDPAHGGTHLPDLTVIAPVFLRPRSAEKGSERIIGFVANRAHHADIGGIAPGSLPLSTELYQEGLIIPPIRLVRGGRLNPDVAAMICANSRTPEERRGDLAAQVAANQTGIRRFQSLFVRYGPEEVERRAREGCLYAEALVRRALRSAPDGEYAYVDYLDDDGQGNCDLSIRVKATIQDGSITFDFNGTGPETAGSVNCTEAVTRSACYYIARCLVDEEIPMNSGAFAPVEVIAPKGTLVNCSVGRGVAAGNVETSQRIVDVLLGALRQAFPNRIPMASQGTMNNVLIGGYDPIRGRPFSYYETICGGAGASATRPGATAIHSHMTNTRNTPIEVLEMHYPLRVREYAIREGSGGNGSNPGGDGVVRSIELLAPAHVSLVTERRRRAPGHFTPKNAARAGINRIQSPDGEEDIASPKCSQTYPAGTVVTVETPGGAGWG